MGLSALISEARSRRSLSLSEVAKRVREAAWNEGARACGVTRHTVHKWERGTVPRPDSLRWLAVALELPVELLVDAVRRGRSRAGRQAGAVGAANRAADGSDGSDEGGMAAVKRRTFLHASAAIVGATMAGPLEWLAVAPVAPDDRPEVALLRNALLRPDSVTADTAVAPDLSAMEAGVAGAWRTYQEARYARAMAALPGVLAQARLAASQLNGDERLSASRLLADTYRLMASALRKLGDRNLSAIAADRARRAAELSGDPIALASSARTLCIALFETGHHSKAIELCGAAAADLGPLATVSSPRHLSVYGMLLLAGAEVAADRGDRPMAGELFQEAERTAARLGQDANHCFTAFGPTNVAVHRIHAAVLLGDGGAAVRDARALDPTRLPVLERRAHHLLDVAAGHGQMNRWSLALSTLLDAERMAREEVHFDPIARSLVAELLQRTRRESADLRGIAGRIGMLR